MNHTNSNSLEQTASLAQRTVRGGLWVFSLRGVNKGLGIIRTIILARFLAPEDFGLFGIALLALSTLEVFSQTGFQEALIQKKGSVASYLDTAWTISVIRGLLLFIILFLAAPVIAEFFSASEAVLIIRIIALSTLLTGFRNIGILFLTKELDFKKKSFYEFSAAFVDLMVSIILVIMLRNVWALVWGGLAGNLVRLIMSFIIHPSRPRFKFEKEKAAELIRYGRWLFGSGILIFLVTQGDDIFVGKILGVTALGFYQMAYLLSNLPATEITHVISQVTFPAYAKLQDNLPRLKTAYTEVVQVTLLVSFPIAGAIFTLGPDFTQIFLGNHWLPMVPALQVLVIAGLIRSTGSLTGPLFQALGRPDQGTKLQIAKLILLLIVIYPLTIRWGILGTALAVVINGILVNPFAHLKALRMVDGRVKDFIKILSIPGFSTLVMSIFLYLIKARLIATQSGFAFIFLLFAGLLTYVFTSAVLGKFLGADLYVLIKRRIFNDSENC
jgi:O-antigen/teichoic acid export membrane protein